MHDRNLPHVYFGKIEDSSEEHLPEINDEDDDEFTEEDLKEFAQWLNMSHEEVIEWILGSKIQ